MNNYRNTPFINNISPVKTGKDMSHIDKYDRNSKINKKEKSMRNMNNRCFSEPINLQSNDHEEEVLHADGLYNQLESKIKSHSELKENIGDLLLLLIFFCTYFLAGLNGGWLFLLYFIQVNIIILIFIGGLLKAMKLSREGEQQHLRQVRRLWKELKAQKVNIMIMQYISTSFISYRHICIILDL
jgi:hypothetical protein